MYLWVQRILSHTLVWVPAIPSPKNCSEKPQLRGWCWCCTALRCLRTGGGCSADHHVKSEERADVALLGDEIRGIGFGVILLDDWMYSICQCCSMLFAPPFQSSCTLWQPEVISFWVTFNSLEAKIGKCPRNNAKILGKPGWQVRSHPKMNLWNAMKCYEHMVELHPTLESEGAAMCCDRQRKFLGWLNGSYPSSWRIAKQRRMNGASCTWVA